MLWVIGVVLILILISRFAPAMRKSPPAILVYAPRTAGYTGRTPPLRALPGSDDRRQGVLLPVPIDRCGGSQSDMCVNTLSVAFMPSLGKAFKS
jgi:hypothetical protein